MNLKLSILLILVVILGQSCKTTHHNTMFKDINEYQISTELNELKKEYIINPGDEIYLKVYSRDGVELIENIEKTSATQLGNKPLIVGMDSILNIPMLGSYNVVGMTTKMLRDSILLYYSRSYINPYIVLTIENRRAIVFKGDEAQIVQLNKTPTNIFEVLAKSGGLKRQFKSYDISIIRGNLRKPIVYKVDLSTMKSIQNSELNIESNDIIYVNENRRPLYYTLTDVAPIITTPLSIVSAVMTSIFLYITINNK